jgi:dTDP-4-dehydrorhamnose 3,5-epimerase
MQVAVTTIPDVILLTPRVFSDERGYFFESFRQDVIDEHIGPVRFVQDNESKSRYGVLRGLHYQRPPFTQSKLVRVISGAILDVVVDIRKGSPWYGQHVAVTLDSDTRSMLWVPQGFAHGFVVLSQDAVVNYKVDHYYAPTHDAGIIWNDAKLAIDWELPSEDLIISEKDSKLNSFSSAGDFQYDEYSSIRRYSRS